MGSFSDWKRSAGEDELLLELMNRRQKQILVHSFLYYQLNTNIISDFTFDMWSKELYNLMQDNKELTKQTEYYKGFKEFTGASGFDLPYGDPKIQSIGLNLIKTEEKRKLNVN